MELQEGNLKERLVFQFSVISESLLKKTPKLIKNSKYSKKRRCRIEKASSTKRKLATVFFQVRTGMRTPMQTCVLRSFAEQAHQSNLHRIRVPQILIYSNFPTDCSGFFLSQRRISETLRF